MSEENVEIIRRGYEHWLASGEIRAHPDFVWDVSNLGWPDQQIYLGAAGANQFNAEWAAQVWTFRDGQAIGMQMYASVADALEAVGLSG
jgi:hypothetical protein